MVKKGVYEQSGDDPAEAQNSLMGPSYNYSAQIKAPAEMGMSSSGDSLANDIGGLISYARLLVEGGGSASRVSTPLGNKYFLQSGAKCKDSDGEVQERALYVNHQADGSIPFITSGPGGVSFSSFKGLIPGVMSNIAQINPYQIVGAFTSGARPKCRQIQMPVLKPRKDANGQYVKDEYDASSEVAYVAEKDIVGMNACWFPGGENPITRKRCVQAFTTMDQQVLADQQALAGKQAQALAGEQAQASAGEQAQASAKKNKRNAHIAMMPTDIIVRMYYISLGFFGLYILYRLFQKKQIA